MEKIILMMIAIGIVSFGVSYAQQSPKITKKQDIEIAQKAVPYWDFSKDVIFPRKSGHKEEMVLV